MSSAGPRRTRPSPAVYRRRRIVALLIVLLLAGGVTWGVLALLGRDDEPAADAAAAGAEVLLTGESGAAPDADATDGPPAEPGEIIACASRDLALEVSTEPSSPAAGAPVTFQLVVRNESQSPCLLDAGPGSLAVSVTSGSDPVWSSAHCAEGSNELLLDAEAHYTIPVRWSGQRSVEGCGDDQPSAAAGTYRATVALAGTPLSPPEPVLLDLR